MEKDLSRSESPLEVRSIAEVTDEEIKYIDDRRHGRIKSLATPWKKYNNVCMGGIDPSYLLCRHSWYRKRDLTYDRRVFKEEFR